MDIRKQLCEEVLNLKDEMVANTVKMVQIPSETPPSDTRGVAACLKEILSEIPGMEIKSYTQEEPVENLIAVLKSGKPGKRLVFNGHMDTYPAGEHTLWDESPWSGSICDGFIYGRGASDMKGGIACFITAAKVLAEHKDLWSGEIVLTLAGDEEAMGPRGTKFLLDTEPDACGDAMICADVGAPDSLRFGQKGLLWIAIEANGRSAHGAHLHKGESAINKLIEVMRRLNEEIPKMVSNPPDFVTKAILEGAEISEKGAGPGETKILQMATINFGTIEGGMSPNLVPAYAKTEADIRIPAGITIAQIEELIQKTISDYEGIKYSVMRAYEANWSDTSDCLFKIVKDNSEEILHKPVVVTFRIGASDSRLYRLIKNVPTINCGLTPYGLGGPNEHVSIEEMTKIAQIHMLSALDFLS